MPDAGSAPKAAITALSSRRLRWQETSERAVADSGCSVQQRLRPSVRQLHYDRDRKAHARIPAVVKVVPIVITDIKVIGVVPVF
jgi:hypothetical protein